MHAPHTTPPPSATTGTLRVRLFAGMAAALGCRSVEIDWDDGTAVALRGRLSEAFPSIAPLLARSAVAIADAYVGDEARVPCGADVAIIPPVSGG